MAIYHPFRRKESAIHDWRNRKSMSEEARHQHILTRDVFFFDAARSENIAVNLKTNTAQFRTHHHHHHHHHHKGKIKKSIACLGEERSSSGFGTAATSTSSGSVSPASLIYNSIEHP
jgi:hypothetical protein